MPKTLRGYRDFGGGLSEASPDNMADNELKKAINIVPDVRGGVKKIDGNVFIGKLDYSGQMDAVGVEAAIDGTVESADVVEIYEFRNTLNTLERLMVLELIITEGVRRVTYYKFYRLEAGAYVAFQVAGSPALLTKPTDAVGFSGVLYVLTGVKMYQTDLSGNILTIIECVKPAATLQDVWNYVIQSSFVEQRGFRFFFAQKNGRAVYYSKVGGFKDIEDLPFDISTNGSEGITALKEYRTMLLVFTQRGIWVLKGYDFVSGTDIQLRKAAVSVGTEHNMSIVLVDNALMYLGVDGMYALTQSNLVAEEFVATNISEGKITKQLTNKDIIAARAIYYDGSYRILLTLANGSYTEYRYLLGNGTWYGEMTYPIRTYFIGDKNTLEFGSYNGYTLKEVRDTYAFANPASNPYVTLGAGWQAFLDGGRINDDYASPIAATMETKAFDVTDNMVTNSKFSKAFVMVKQFENKNSSAELIIKVDYLNTDINVGVGTSVEFNDSLAWDLRNWDVGYWGFTDVLAKEIRIKEKGKRVAIIMNNHMLNEPLTVYGFAFLYKAKKQKGSRVNVTTIERGDFIG